MNATPRKSLAAAAAAILFLGFGGVTLAATTSADAQSVANKPNPVVQVDKGHSDPLPTPDKKSDVPATFKVQAPAPVPVKPVAHKDAEVPSAPVQHKAVTPVHEPAVKPVQKPVAKPTPTKETVVNMCGHNEVRPGKLMIACADGNLYIGNITWSSWGTEEALGEGTLSRNQCDPNCAEGTFEHTKVSVRLWAPNKDGVFQNLTTHDGEYLTNWNDAVTK
jgi:hypothetical protein